MISINYFVNRFLKKNRVPAKTSKQLKLLTITNKSLLVICFIIFLTSNVIAQKGLFVKFSLGPGYTTETTNLKSSALSILTKNHAIGWGISENWAILIGDIGGLNKYKVGDYNYINLDIFGLGFSYRTPLNLKISAVGGYSVVSLAKKSSEAMGDNDGKGFGFNTSIEKEWFIAKRWGFRVGPQIFWLKTTNKDYNFFTVSLNASLVFYLTPFE